MDLQLPPVGAAVFPDGELASAQRRRFLIEFCRRRIRPGTGSAPEFLHRRTAMNSWPDLRPILHLIPWAVVGGVATRAYMPERATKDLHILVRAVDGAAVRQQLEAAGFDPAKIHVVYDTIDFEETLKKSLEPLMATLPATDKHPAILVPATLIPKKGQDTAIKAVARLKAAGLDPVLWLAGNVVGEDNSYEVYLKDLTKQLDVTENVFFLGWRSDVPAMMMQADRVVLPTHEEGFGHVILEAMLLKRPVLATPVGGIKDSIQDGLNGLLFPVQDEKQLAEQIMKIQNDPAFVQRMIENGYKTVTERFTPEAHTQHCLEALNIIINKQV